MHIGRPGGSLVGVLGLALMALSASQLSPALAVPLALESSVAPGTVVGWSMATPAHYPNPAEAIPDEVRSGVTSVAVGAGHALAVKDGRVFAWGSNEFGQTDVPAEAQSGVTAVAAGTHFSLALKDGRVLAWGRNEFGQADVPTEALSGVSAISAGFAHVLAIKNGGVLAWGASYGGRTEVPAEAQAGVTAVSAGVYSSFAVATGRVIAWGMPEELAAVPAEAIQGVSDVSAGVQHALALKAGGVIAWGEFGQIAVPQNLQSGVSAIAAGRGFSLAVKNGQVFAFGSSGLRVPTDFQSGVVLLAAGRYDPPFNIATRVAPLVKPPGKVSGLKAVPAKGAIHVTWLPPADLGGAPAVTYEYRTGAGNWAPTNATNVTVRGPKGKKLKIVVRAVNAAGPGPPSTVSAKPQ